VVLLAHDAYYRDLKALSEEDRGKTNFDSPEALETELLAQHLDALKAGRPVTVPVYDFATHTRVVDEGRAVNPSTVVIVEGILLFSDPAICERLDLRVFVETDADERVLRRIRRDVDERARSVASVMDQYLATVKPMHELYVEPSRAQADLVVSGGGDTAKAVELIVAHVEARLGEG
jgi:uridine kinase